MPELPFKEGGKKGLCDSVSGVDLNSRGENVARHVQEVLLLHSNTF